MCCHSRPCFRIQERTHSLLQLSFTAAHRIHIRMRRTLMRIWATRAAVTWATMGVCVCVWPHAKNTNGPCTSRLRAMSLISHQFAFGCSMRSRMSLYIVWRNNYTRTHTHASLLITFGFIRRVHIFIFHHYTSRVPFSASIHQYSAPTFV